MLKLKPQFTRVTHNPSRGEKFKLEIHSACFRRVRSGGRSITVFVPWANWTETVKLTTAERHNAELIEARAHAWFKASGFESPWEDAGVALDIGFEIATREENQPRPDFSVDFNSGAYTSSASQSSETE